MDESLEKEADIFLGTLDKKEADIRRLYFGIVSDRGASLGEIGKIFNLTRKRLRQLKQKALKKLRTKKECARLKVYMD